MTIARLLTKTDKIGTMGGHNLIMFIKYGKSKIDFILRQEIFTFNHFLRLATRNTQNIVLQTADVAKHLLLLDTSINV